MKRKQKNELFLKAEKGFLTAVKKLILENPILISGLSLGPVVAISQSLKAGVSLSVAFAIIIVPVLVLFAVNPIKIPKSILVILAHCSRVCFSFLLSGLLKTYSPRSAIRLVFFCR